MTVKINPEDYMKLGYKVVHTFLKMNPHLYYLQEDLEQEGMLAVCEAAKRFVDRGKVKFSTFCAISVQNKILKFLRDNENKFRNIATCSVEELTLESEDTIDWQDMIGGTAMDVEAYIRELPVDLRLYAKLMISGKTKHEIREELGCSWEHLEQLKERTINHIDKMLM